jgi:hypothetical protein
MVDKKRSYEFFLDKSNHSPHNRRGHTLDSMTGVLYENNGKTDLELFKFFGPDMNNDLAPRLAAHLTSSGRRE